MNELIGRKAVDFEGGKVLLSNIKGQIVSAFLRIGEHVQKLIALERYFSFLHTCEWSVG